MSINEMILFLEYRCPMDVEKEDIIAALKAGQAMRDTAAFFPDAEQGPEAWDAAIGGEG